MSTTDLPASGVGTDEAIRPEYHHQLTNEDLAPLKKRTWSWYNVFAFWMSDVHSVGGYVTAGSLFALGLPVGRSSSVSSSASSSSRCSPTWWPSPAR